MSQYLWDSNRSQCSFLDQNFSVYSTTSKTRSHKYFSRKPIETQATKLIVTKRKQRLISEFSGFYSPVHKSDALTQRVNIQKAIPKSSETKNKIIQQDGVLPSNVQLEIRHHGKELKQPAKIFITSEAKKSFRKKKQQDSLLVKSVQKQKENAQQKYSLLNFLETQNKILKQQIADLKQQNTSYQSRLVQLPELQKLKQKISFLQSQLESSQSYSKQLQIEIQNTKNQQYETTRTLDSIYQDSIRSLNEINRNLKHQIYDLNQKLKYIGIQIRMLKKNFRFEYKDVDLIKIVEEKNRLQKQNRDLKIQVVKLRQGADEISLDLSRSNSEISI